MIKLKDVSKFYYNKGIITSGFNKVSAEFNLGEFVVITGESGSGKSTLLNVISGLDSYEEGEMYINGSETSHYTEEDFENYRKKYISNIFQNFNLVNSYTVYQNIELVLLINGFKRRDVKKKIIELIKSVDLYKYRNTKVSKLSGGQKQRVAIARALAKNTPIIIVDEPTGNLDKRSAESVIETLSEVAKEKLVIVVTHNYEQMEEHATRKITMHDGKIIEDKILKKTDILPDKVDNKFKQITFGNKIRLGVRNAFNIKTKFILLLIVYLFMTAALISEHSSFEEGKYNESTTGTNEFFGNKSDKRLILKKNDKTFFTEDDYKKITSIKNVDYIVKNDLELDSSINLTNDNYYFNGLTKNINKMTEKLVAGNLPKNSNEIVINGFKNDYNLSKPNELIGIKVTYNNPNTGEVDSSLKYKIVGVSYSKESSYGEYSIYGNDEFLSLLGRKTLENINTIKGTLNSTILDNPIKYLDNVPEGYVYIPESLQGNCLNGYCINKIFNIKITNMYYENNIDLKIKKIINKNNLNYSTGLKNYDIYSNYIFMNTNDYNKILNTNNYQTSVFVKDAKDIKETKQLLENSNYNTLIVTDSLVTNNNGFKYILNILNVLATSTLIIVMFFISYFIIKIILKSRNTYYSTLRILGSNKKTSKKLLEIELFTITNIAFIIVLTLIILINKDVIVSNNIKNLLLFMKLKDYMFIYVSLIIMTYLISIKFSRSLFKKSAMKTYNEEA